jgi:hypothetical protein
VKRTLFALSSWLLAPAAFAILDTNNNGVSDFWERDFHNGSLFDGYFDLQGDTDADGWTNAQEAAAGTNPFDPNPPDGLIRPDIVHTPALWGEENGVPYIDTPEAVTVTWPTLPGKQYTMYFSPDLTQGSWLPVGSPFIAQGGVSEYGFYEVSAADKRFWRVAVEDIDSDSDGLSDHEEYIAGTNPTISDTDGDGISDGAEAGQGTDPNDAEDAAAAEWFVLTGDGAEGEVKSETRTFTIKKGDSRVLVIGTTSEEYPDFTSEASEYDDILSWEINATSEAVISDTVHVNDRHVDWEIDLVDGVTLQGYSPVHIEKVKVLNASATSDANVTIKLEATNISDEWLPSTVIVGLLPVRISPDVGMVGIIGDRVESNKGEGGEKHFVTPKKSPEIGEEFVKLKAKGLEDAWLTPGDPNQLVEWDPSVGESNGDVRKWKVKRDVTEKFPVKIRTIAKYGNEQAMKRNVWVTWANLELTDDTPKMQTPTSTQNSLTLVGEIRFRYLCEPSEMFDLNPDIPYLSKPWDVAPPGGNHPWKGTPLAFGADIKYDASRQFRVISKSNDPSTHTALQAEGSDVLDYPGDIAVGNDDPSTTGEVRPYDPPGITAKMTDFDTPYIVIPHSRGSATPNATVSQTAQFRQFARAELGARWYKCSDYVLSELHLKAKRENGKWIDDGSTFLLGNNPFPPP